MRLTRDVATGYAYQCDLDRIQGQGQGHGASEFPKIALFYVYLCHFKVELKTHGR